MYIRYLLDGPYDNKFEHTDELIFIDIIIKFCGILEYLFANYNIKKIKEVGNKLVIYFDNFYEKEILIDNL